MLCHEPVLQGVLLGGALLFAGAACAQDGETKGHWSRWCFHRPNSHKPVNAATRRPAPQQRVDLPDSWNKQQRPRSAIGWYRVSFKLATVPRTPQAIYIPRVTNNVAVHINDVFIGTSGRIEEREMSWNLAQIFSVPPSLLKSGDNELLIRLHPDDMPRAGLSEIQFGDDGTLRPQFERRVFLANDGPRCSSPACWFDRSLVLVALAFAPPGNGVRVFPLAGASPQGADLAHLHIEAPIRWAGWSLRHRSPG